MGGNSHGDEILEIKRRRLRELEKQAARYGQDCPAHVSLEIADLHKEIAELDPDQTRRANLVQAPEQATARDLLEELLSKRDVTNIDIQNQIAKKESVHIAQNEQEMNSNIASSKVSISRKKLRGKLRIFLCHSSGDKDVVYHLYHDLKRDGFRPWLDKENLVLGQDWDLEIVREVRETHVVIVCLSHHSTTKEGYFHKEIKVALDTADEKPEGTIYIIPVMIEACLLPMRLGKWHAEGLYEPQGYEKLVTALQMRAEQLQAAGMLTRPAQNYSRIQQTQASKSASGKARTSGSQTRSQTKSREQAARVRTSMPSTTLRTTQSHTRAQSTNINTFNQGPYLTLRKDWRMILKRNAIYIWVIIFSICVLIYRAAGVIWFANDALMLLSFISLIIFANTHNRRGLFPKIARAICVVYSISLIAAYAIFYLPRGVKFIQVSTFAAVTGFDTINAMLLAMAVACAIWLLSRIFKM
jgi:hypothetical protein